MIRLSKEIPFEPEEAAEELEEANDIVDGKGLCKCANPKCRKRFPVNYKKHPGRRVITCPFCRQEMFQPYLSSDWKPKPIEKERPKSKPFTLETMRRVIMNANWDARILDIRNSRKKIKEDGMVE